MTERADDDRGRAAPHERWDPAQYERFADQRERPALELLARVPEVRARTVWDLGCGTGSITRRLRERFPEARVVGVDRSPEMLAQARAGASGSSARGLAGGAIAWREADLATWRPDEPADVIFSNAALHWIEDHDELFERLVASLRPGGVLAVQMPRNHGAASHRAVRATLADLDRGSPELRARMARPPVDEPLDYWRRLAPHARPVDVWESEYVQELAGPDAVLEWLRGTTLRPVLAELTSPERAAFEADLARRLAEAYPPGPDGRTPFPFRRLFVVAVAARGG